jgi:cytoskeleton protein RodZ
MSIGTQLRQAREAQSISLDQVAQATHIKVHYLEALELDHFEMLPSTAQLRGFLRAYGDYLKLNSSGLIEELGGNVIANPEDSLPSTPSSITPNSTGSDAIFKELGRTLKSQRELMGLSLGDVERHTHIRVHYIRALEEGDISHLPSPVQGRGMLSNYASFLGLNTETILLRFADGLQASLYDRQAARNATSSLPRSEDSHQIPVKPSQLKRILSMDLFVGGFLILFLLGFTIWGALRISRLNSGIEPSSTAPPVSEILLVSPTGDLLKNSTPLPTIQITAVIIDGTVSPVIAETIATSPTPTSVAFALTPGLQNAPVQVYVIGVQTAWMRMTVDGEVAFEGRVIPGSAYSYAGKDRIELLTGNGAGLRVYYNQQDLGLIGAFGEVVELTFSIEGIQTATPAVRPSSTPAPTSPTTPTMTPTGSGLLVTPSPTPKP